MSARRAMEGRIFAALEEVGPMPREELARRATLSGDAARASRIVRDMIEEGSLAEAPGGRLDRSPPRSALEAMIRHNKQRRAAPEPGEPGESP